MNFGADFGPGEVLLRSPVAREHNFGGHQFKNESLQPEANTMNMDSSVVSNNMATDGTEAYHTDDSDVQRAESNWGYYYRDASIYLDEGLNNDKFDSHPTIQTMRYYMICHNPIYYVLDLLASLFLLALGLAEEPEGDRNGIDIGAVLPVAVHGTLELFMLTLLVIGLVVKLKWRGPKLFFTHKRSVTKLVVISVMYIEAITVLIRQKNHMRATRALRPIFLIDSHYCGGVRRMLRQVLQSLPPILDMLFLLLFLIIIFAVLGFYLFSSNEKDIFFKDFGTSFVSLFVLLTTANYPDVMMPSYANSRWSILFFAVYITIVLYFLMNLLLAVVYDTFTSIEREKFKRLFLHKRQAVRHAYRLLCPDEPPHWVSLPRYFEFMKIYKPKLSLLKSYLVFRALDTENKGSLSLDDTYNIYEQSAFSWKKVTGHDDEWFHFLSTKRRFKWLYRVIKRINSLVTRKAFEYVIFLIIIVNGCVFVYEIVRISKLERSERQQQAMESHWYTIIFITLYGAEALLKIVGLGLRKYFSSGWNVFDFLVTVFGIIGTIGKAAKKFAFGFIVCLRPLRLLLLFKLKRRYRDVLETIVILMPRMLRVVIVILLLYYFYGIIGIECFAGLELKNCCNNTPVEMNFREEGYYYLNNFDDLLHVYVTLFELTVVNNWFIIMEGVVYVTNQWARIYFMSFFIVTMVVMTIVVAFVLEAFLFRIQYRKEDVTEEDDDVFKEITLTYDELKNLDQSLVEGLQCGDEVKYRGTRHKTKMDISVKMYSSEVEDWIHNERVLDMGEVLGNFEVTEESLRDYNQGPAPLTPRLARAQARARNSYGNSPERSYDGDITLQVP